MLFRLVFSQNDFAYQSYPNSKGICLSVHENSLVETPQKAGWAPVRLVACDFAPRKGVHQPGEKVYLVGITEVGKSELSKFVILLRGFSM